MRKLETINNGQIIIYGFHYNYSNKLERWFPYANIYVTDVNTIIIDSDYFYTLNSDDSYINYKSKEYAEEIIKQEFAKFMGEIHE